MSPEQKYKLASCALELREFLGELDGSITRLEKEIENASRGLAEPQPYTVVAVDTHGNVFEKIVRQVVATTRDEAELLAMKPEDEAGRTYVVAAVFPGHASAIQ